MYKYKHILNLSLNFIILIPFLLMIPSIVNGQNLISIHGKVTTSKGIELGFASVKLFEDSIAIAGTVCDSLGSFELKINENILSSNSFIQAFYLQLASKPIHVMNNSKTIHLIIQDSAKNLSEIVVKSTKPLLERKADRFIFTPDKELARGSSALDIMRHAPLILFNERNETFSIINKSGTVIYINNKKSSLPKEMIIAMLRALPAGDIKNIEIITNPGSEYEASTTGGIININLKHQLYEGWLGNLSVQSQQSVYNTTILNGAINYSKGKIAVQVIPFINNSFNYYTNKNRLTYHNGLQNNLNTDFYRRYVVLGGGLNLDYNINEKNSINFSGWRTNVYGKSNTTTLTTYTKIDQDNPDSMQNSITKGKDFYIYNFGNFNYHLNTDPTGSSYLDFNIDYNDFFQRRRYDGAFNKVDNNGKIINEIGQYKNNLPESFFNLSERIEYSLPVKTWKFNIGGQYSDTRVNDDLHYYDWKDGDYTLNTKLSNNYYYIEKYWAGYISVAKSFKKWDAKIGLRTEGTNYSTKIRNLNIADDSTYLNLFPSAAISYSPDAQNQFGFSFARKINRPNIELLFPGRTYNNPNYFTENNPFLQPVLFNNSEFSYTFHNNYTLSVSYSNGQNAYSNFVLPVIENDIPKMKNTYVNYGTINSLGIMINCYQPLFNGLWKIYFTPSFDYSRYHSHSPQISADIKNYSFNISWNNNIYISKAKQWTAFLTFNFNSPVKDISGSTLNATSSLDIEIKKAIKNFSFYLIFADIYNGSSIVKRNLFPNYLLQNNFTESNSYNRAVALSIRYSFGNNRIKKVKQHNTANQSIRNRIPQ